MLNESIAMRRGGRIVLLHQLCAIVVFNIALGILLLSGNGEDFGGALMLSFLRMEGSPPVLLLLAGVLATSWLLGLLAARAVYRKPQRYDTIAFGFAGISIVVCTGALWGYVRWRWEITALDPILGIASCMGAVIQIGVWLWACRRMKRIFVPD